MSCYLRHMKGLLDEAGIEVTKDNKREIDRIVHDFVGVEYKDCSPAWRRVKEDVLADPGRRASLVNKIKSAKLSGE
jgi:hypothetical protein